MIIFGAVLSAYAVMAAIAWAAVAYSIGKHYGEAHDGERSKTCQMEECLNPVLITTFLSLFWPLALIILAGLWWTKFWNTAGANSTMPAENSLPEKKKKKTDVEFVE